MTEKANVKGHSLVKHIQRILARRDVRRICIMDEERSLLEIPVAVGDPAAPASALKAPVLAAIKAFGTLTDECVVAVESTEETH